MTVLLDVNIAEHRLGGRLIIDRLAIRISELQNVAIMAPSGAGKSTLLRMIAGLDPTQLGSTIQVHGKEIRGPGKHAVLMAQDVDAFPWMTAAENVWRFGGWPASEVKARTSALLAEVGLGSFEDYFPLQMSGGMKKRLALARVLATGTAVVLLDEPFASLDLKAKRAMSTLFLRIQRERGYSAILVTHDVLEAIGLADLVIICSGSPLRIEHEIRVPREQGSSFDAVDESGVAMQVRNALLATDSR
jgi:NitT/TauT family transport system ATP-binding protein